MEINEQLQSLLRTAEALGQVANDLGARIRTLSAGAQTLASQQAETQALAEASAKQLADSRAREATLQHTINELLKQVEQQEGPIPVLPAGPVRDRSRVTQLIVEEFAKQTSVIPGGDINDPSKAIQLWTTEWIVKHDALNADEPSLRRALALAVSFDVDEWGMNRTGPRPDGAKIPELTRDGVPFVDSQPSPKVAGTIRLPENPEP